MKQTNILDSREDGSYDVLLEQMRRDARWGTVVLVITILVGVCSLYGAVLFFWMLIQRVIG